MARTQNVGRAFVALRIKKGPPGVDGDMWVLSYGIPIIVRGDLKDEVAYEFVKTLWKHYGELKGIFRPLATWTPNRFASTQALIPYHSGAIKFYKEVGAWTPEMEKHQAKLKSRM
ncbi:MAG: hypothetical protein A3F84_12045 [Candidatus Handelsmanbacteria bacterium RIFCSPLOWO2_12_FULL_64_10]|uniref:C4-dicarboxylate ABC transporter substrate-binding protein n=1 Tax=Handelsmanbacteria sp. (strain RIFCSPLOWO2_12_FULL_64_10) TaxID=1817868 RepID=A0A1F6CTY0_HANXR|nr:MAG: hypothetical protein A3F84_12045 [Candidatus Handelsmanbacteria bacterium RIFCSPLOWO2_12_FULL_64_10]